MCELMGIEMHDHHDALADATACAEIVLKGAGIDVTHHHYEKPDYKSHKSLTGEVKQPLADEEINNKDNPFFHQKVVITGVFTAFPDREKLAFRLRDCGADINSSISAKTNIVVKGEGAGPSKMEKIKKLNEKGANIRVIEEKEMVEIVEKYGI